MSDNLSRLIVLTFALCIAQLASAQMPLRIDRVSGYHQVFVVDTVSPEPFVARITNFYTGEPLAGVAVDMFVNHRHCLPWQPNCSPPPPPPALYGSFQPGNASSVLLYSNENGLVTSPAFRAGSLPGRYEVAAILRHSTSYVAFDVRQVLGEPPRPVPLMSTYSLCLLAGVMLVAIYRCAPRKRLR